MNNILAVMIAVCVSACASTPKPPPAFKALPHPARGEIRNMEILIGVDQQEIDVGNQNYVWLPLERSGQYGSFGLGAMSSGRHSNGKDALYELGVIVGVTLVAVTAGLVVGTGEAGMAGYRSYMANRAMAPVHHSLTGFDLGERLREALTRTEGPQLLLRDGRVTLVSPATPQNFEAHYTLSVHDSVMMINVRYAVSSDLNTMTLKADANLFPRSDALWKLQYENFRKGQRMDKLPGALQTDTRHSLYRRVMNYETTLPLRETDRDKAARAWSANEGALVRGAFNEGLEVIARMVASDLAGTRVEGLLEVHGKRYGVTRDKDDMTRVSKLM